MKGKIILTFVFALLALTFIGLVGQNTLTQLIVSIKKDSEPNQKLTALKEVLAALSDAENSVRTYTITRESENLTPFYESISTIDYKLNGLYKLIDNKEQLILVDSMKLLIEEKYSTLKELIDIKKDNDVEAVFERVLENIAKLRERDSVPQPITSGPPDFESVYDRIKKVRIPEPKQEPRKISIFQRIFGGWGEKDDDDENKKVASKETDDPTSLSPDKRNITRSYVPPISDNDLNSSDIGHIISKIGRERNESIKAIQEQELALTLQDNVLSQQIRKISNQIEDREKWVSMNRAKAAEKATGKATDIISITWITALIIFALLLFIIFNDIARNKRNKERLKQAKIRAEKLARVKEEFLSNMSHEIRTPLNCIIGYTEQLEHTFLAPEQQKYLKSIHYSGNHLLSIINDILDYAKLESGKLKLESIGFTIKTHIEEVIESFQSEIEKKNLAVSYTIDEKVPEVLIGDPVRFKQILINLLSNAIKFTPSGTIEINVYQQEQKYGMAKLRLVLKDSGIGIPKDKVDSIFLNFAQVDSSTTRKYGGTGLGLSIVKKIVDMHDGHVAVESEEGKGTTFIIDLKYKIGDIKHLANTPENIPVHHNHLSGKKVMVVDDQEYNLELIKLIFNKWEVNTTMLTSGREAIEALRKQHYDLILMDIQMPEMSGLEATIHIRSIEEEMNRHTPIVALTAAASKEEADQCLKAGMDGYLLKPFTQSELYTNIAKILAVKNGTIVKEDLQNTPATPARRDQTPLNVDELLQLSNGDTSFVGNMLKIFTTNFEADLRNLQKGLENRDWAELKAKSHKMMPSCSHLNLKKLALHLKEVEKASEDQNYQKISSMVAGIAADYKALKPAIEQEINKLQKYPSESAA